VIRLVPSREGCRLPLKLGLLPVKPVGPAQRRMARPLRSSPITGPSSLLRGSPPLSGASVLSAHEPHVIGPMAAHIVLPAIHRVFSNLKTWGLGVYHGLRRKHLQAYLDEFAFRFNRRKSRHAAFATILGIAAGHEPVSYKMLRAVGSTG